MRPRQATTVQPLPYPDTSVGSGWPLAEVRTCELLNLLVRRVPARVHHLRPDGDFPDVIEPPPPDTASSREYEAAGWSCK
jgi:hypothetical protein